MMNALGVKIVIVAGNRFQLERNLRIRGVPLGYRGIPLPQCHLWVLGALGVGYTRWDAAVQ